MYISVYIHASSSLSSARGNLVQDVGLLKSFCFSRNLFQLFLFCVFRFSFWTPNFVISSRHFVIGLALSLVMLFISQTVTLFIHLSSYLLYIYITCTLLFLLLNAPKYIFPFYLFPDPRHRQPISWANSQHFPFYSSLHNYYFPFVSFVSDPYVVTERMH